MGQSGIVLRQIRTLWDEGRLGDLSDAELLERFISGTDAAREAAFEALILRHGPIVLGICRHILRDSCEVEDAFQATFLILARRAGSIRKGEVVGGWLCRVAHRVAVRARALAARRSSIHSLSRIHADSPDELVERGDLCAVVIGEVQLLPEKYRLPVQLCYLEGRTHDEAAEQLAWPVGTVRTRLAWARDRLRARLTRRGLALSTGLIGTTMTAPRALAGVAAPLVEATTGAAIGRSLRTEAAQLAANVLRATFMSQLKLTVIMTLLIGSVAGIALALTAARNGDSPRAILAPVGRSEERRSDRPQSEARQESPPVREVNTVFFRVIAADTKQPLAGVTLKVLINGNIVSQHVTDKSGRIVIPLPRERFQRLTVAARKDGLAPMRVDLKQDDAPDVAVPRSYALAMARATSIGGIVRDDEGHPIEGASVSFYQESPDDSVPELIDLNGVSASTDSQGRWHINVIPEGFNLGPLQVTISHPEFLGPFDSSALRPDATPEQLRARSGVTVLHRGLSVTGRVMDREGRPLVGATVRLLNRSQGPSLKTDADGRFRFQGAPAGERTLAVEAAGHAPGARSVRVHDGLPPIEFRLGAGRIIRERVVDPQARPVAGAYIHVDRWDPAQTLDWRSQTDAEGRFVWDCAPSDRIWLGASKRGYRAELANVGPLDKEITFTLTPATPLRVHGTVTDAETARPIGTFTIVPMVEPGHILLLDEARTHHDGQYVLSDIVHPQPCRFSIEAKGYLPALSPPFAHDAGDQVFEARLKRGQWIEGTVRGRDGAPLAGAEVVLARGSGVHISGGNDYQRRHHPHLRTGTDGRFSFSPPATDTRILALHDQGSAETTTRRMREQHDLLIQPWARIEGTLRAGGRLLPHETVVADSEAERMESLTATVQHDNRAQTDEHGHFVIERLPPANTRVFWQPEARGARKQPDRYYQPAFVQLAPGHTARLDIVHEGGLPLVGRIVVRDPQGRELAPAAAITAYVAAQLPNIPYPPDLTEQERREWFDRWRTTEAGSAYRQARRGFAHGLELQADGSFRVAEIQAGAYELHVHIPGRAPVIRPITIPEPDHNHAGVLVDLGVLAVESPPAPDRRR
jgi:RNA polymerase sigma factor (sigma-70 family)